MTLEFSDVSHYWKRFFAVTQLTGHMCLFVLSEKIALEEASRLKTTDDESDGEDDKDGLPEDEISGIHRCSEK